MGSGTKRKEKDQVLIKRPKTSITAVSNDTDLNELCPVTIKVKIENNRFISMDDVVELIQADEYYEIYIGGEKIGALNKKQSDTIVKCSKIGIKYKGSIFEESGNFYARFIRVA